MLGWLRCALIGLVLWPIGESARPLAAEGKSQDVKLVLQITVDGLRGDLLRRYGHRFGKGGFRYLLEHGAVYANAHYQHANTETIVGHTTLATGALPSQHGMIGNVWLDRETGELSYNIEDPDHPLLATRGENSKAAQLDPAQKVSRTEGRSPASILASTFSDELAVFSAGRSKIFAVSGKDRGAVSMAGHAGKAFWFSTDTGDFVTSTFYYEAYPDWVIDWNARRMSHTYAHKAWSLLNDRSSYLLADFDDRPYETDLQGYGRVFPHQFGTPENKLFLTRLFVSPVGDRLTADFAKALIKNETLGKRVVPDYLAISFSSVDAVNHFFGPSSLENEDIVLQLDRTLANLFSYIDDEVGLEHTLIVLSADHGMAEMPEFMAEKGFPAGRLYPEKIVKAADAVAQRHFGIPKIAQFFFRPYLYLDGEAISRAKLDRTEVERVVADGLSEVEGVAVAVSRSALRSAHDTPALKQIRNNFHSSRSGDIYVVQEPYWFLFERGPITAMHGSPWKYDTYVPLIFAGPDIPARTIYRRVHPVDVAPTLSAFLGVKPPSSAVGNPLPEILKEADGARP